MLFLLIFTLAIVAPESTTRYWWDFETGWQGWTHTNPAGWDVVWSGTNPPPPFAGDSSMLIDSNGGCSDTALSPVVVPPANMSLLKYGYYNYGGSGSYLNELHVGIKYFTGGVWNVVELQLYPAGVISGPAWDSVDISGYAASDSVQVYFYYTDLGTWGFYSAFDNVMIIQTGVAERPVTQTPLVFGFAPDMPTVTKHPTIVYTTTTPGKVCLKVYDNTGRLIRTLVDHPNEPASTKTVYWDSKDVAHRTVPNGVYFVGLKTEEKEATRKIVLIR